MNILGKIGIVCTLSGMGALVFGVSEAAFCQSPSNPNGPYHAINTQTNNQTVSCTVPGNLAQGLGVGRLATFNQPKRICANLQFGRDAQVNAYTGINGSLITGCVKHDSIADGLEACDLTGCASAQAFQLTVQN